MAGAVEISEVKLHLRLAYEYALLTQYSNNATQKYYTDLLNRHFLQAAKMLGYAAVTASGGEVTANAGWPPEGGE